MKRVALRWIALGVVFGLVFVLYDPRARDKRIFNALSQAESWASRQSEGRFPASELANHPGDRDWAEQHMKSRQAFYSERKRAAWDVVGRTFGVGNEELERIDKNGTLMKWKVYDEPVRFDPSTVNPPSKFP